LKTEKREPRISPKTIELIKQMASENRLWGAERIRGELLSVHTDAVTKIITKRHQRIVDGLFVLGRGSGTECFMCFSMLCIFGFDPLIVRDPEYWLVDWRQ